MQFRITFIALVAIAALALGCGGDGSANAALTKPEFIKQANAICGEADARNQPAVEEFADENGFELNRASEKQLERAVAAVIVPSLNQLAEELAALGAPEGDEEQVEAITVSLEEAAAEIKKTPGIVFGAEALKEPSRLAEAYGLEVCGED